MTSWGLTAQEQRRALVISSAPAAAVAPTLPYTAVLALTQLALNVWEAHCSDMRGAQYPARSWNAAQAKHREPNEHLANT